jgi:CheY-like chemotaxis protein
MVVEPAHFVTLDTKAGLTRVGLAKRARNLKPRFIHAPNVALPRSHVYTRSSRTSENQEDSKSPYGKGATMTTPKAELAEPTINSYRAKPRTLVIDDDKAVADTVAMVLNSDEFEARAVYSSEAGVELARSLKFEFLVTGVMMPQMNGIEAAIQIRELLPRCKVLLVSGDNGSSALLQDALSRGYKFEVLAKPVHPLVLFQTLRSFGTAQSS